MGAWGYGIMESDDADDVRVAFGNKWADGSPTPDQAVKWIQGYSIGDEVATMAACWLIMSRSARFSDELRHLGNQAIDSAVDEIEDWSDPAARAASLEQFRDILLHYPNEGATVALSSNGLLDTIIGHLPNG